MTEKMAVSDANEQRAQLQKQYNPQFFANEAKNLESKSKSEELKLQSLIQTNTADAALQAKSAKYRQDNPNASVLDQLKYVSTNVTDPVKQSEMLKKISDAEKGVLDSKVQSLTLMQKTAEGMHNTAKANPAKLPEIFDYLEKEGVPKQAVDQWRKLPPKVFTTDDSPLLTMSTSLRAESEATKLLRTLSLNSIAQARLEETKKANDRKDSVGQTNDVNKSIKSLNDSYRATQSTIKSLEAQIKPIKDNPLLHDTSFSFIGKNPPTEEAQLLQDDLAAKELDLKKKKAELQDIEDQRRWQLAKLTPEARTKLKGEDAQQRLKEIQSEEGSKSVPMAMPASAKEAVVGKWYNTSRGLAQWNGSKFVTTTE